MKTPLQIVLVEDNSADAELVEAMLAGEGTPCRITRVATRSDFQTALEQKDVGLLISDFSMPGFDGLSALRIAREVRPDVPFIFVSGTIGEDQAVKALKQGATDFVLKDRLGRLPSAVQRACREADERSERRHMEEQLRQAQKMEAIGRLAGGIAHDFNNLLVAIIGFSDLLLLRMTKEDKRRADVEQIKHAGLRASELTRQLLAFSRKQILQPRVLNLNEVVTNLIKMLKRLIGENIHFSTVTDPMLGRVKADPGQLEQVIVNLVVNARDAMSQGGELTIQTANIQLDEAYAREHLQIVPGNYVMLAVSDTGSGMTAEVKTHLFEPFFTTKEPGKGTGLGLSTVYGIVKQSGGEIEVDSEEGVGTTFKIYLPRVEDKVGVSTETAPSANGGSEVILLVEDEICVRTLIEKLLKEHGYTVLEAQHGAEALSICAEHSGPIDLLITDLVMPQIGGRVLAEKLTADRRGMKVLYISGYSDDAALRQGLLNHEMPFLQKPFTSQALLSKVREVLGVTGVEKASV